MYRIITLLSLLTVVLAAWGRMPDHRDYHPAPVQIADSTLRLDVSVPTLPGGAWRVEERLSLADLKERSGYSAGSIKMSVISAAGDTLGLGLRWGNTAFGDLTDRRFTQLTVQLADSTLYCGEVDGFATASGQYNTLAASFDPDRGKLTVSGGGRRSTTLFTQPFSRSFDPVVAELSVRGRARVSVFGAETTRRYGNEKERKYADIDSLIARVKASPDSIEGVWEYLDRTNDPLYTRPGGRYTLATIANDEGSYDIVYIGGATVYPVRWQPGMIKGKLRPTIFIDHFDLEWIDAEFVPMTEDIHASVTDGAILTLSFPLYKSEMRFSRQRRLR